jgi:predicted nucleic acid-binding Zn ribbon protein
VKQSVRDVSHDDVAEGLEQAAILLVRHIYDRAALSASMALGTLHREGPVRVTALAAASGIGQPSMTELVNRLQRVGLVTRVEDPRDGRAALITITNAGRALLDDRRRERRQRLAELLAALTPQDEATLTLAMHVALPVIQELIHNAQQSRTQTDDNPRQTTTPRSTSPRYKPGTADSTNAHTDRTEVAEGTVLGYWSSVMGQQIADHATATALNDGVLSVVAESTAWATQLQMIQAELLAKIAAAVGNGVVTSLKISSFEPGPPSITPAINNS